jgi:hypothetical protein
MNIESRSESEYQSAAYYARAFSAQRDSLGDLR